MRITDGRRQAELAQNASALLRRARILRTTRLRLIDSRRSRTPERLDDGIVKIGIDLDDPDLRGPGRSPGRSSAASAFPSCT